MNKTQDFRFLLLENKRKIGDRIARVSNGIDDFYTVLYRKKTVMRYFTVRYDRSTVRNPTHYTSCLGHKCDPIIQLFIIVGKFKEKAKEVILKKYYVFHVFEYIFVILDVDQNIE